MEQKKKTRIIMIIMIILLVVILLAGGAYAYLATDIFRSNKQLFFQYAGQITNNEEGFIEKDLKAYFEKQSNTPYTNEGIFEVQISAENGQDQFDYTNQMNLSFNGQVDNASSKNEQKLSLNYSNEVKFPLNYKQIENNIGIQTHYIGSKFVSIETDKLNNQNESSNNIEDVSKTADKLTSIKDIAFSNEEMENIKNTYLSILNEQIPDTNFSKIEEANTKGYKLKIDGQTIKNILVSLLETLKNDQITLDKLNEIIKTQKNSSKLTASNIDNLIKDINNSNNLNNENLEITVYQTKRQMNKLVIQTNEVKAEIQKNKMGNESSYQIDFEVNTNNQIMKVTLIAKYEGLQANQSVAENYELILTLPNNMEYKYIYNNNVNFTDNVNIEEFSNNNSLFLTQMEQEQKASFLNAVIERITEVNKKQMEQLGLLENENPLQYIIPILSLNTDLFTATGMKIPEEVVNSFNKRFELYQNSNLQGVTVRGLMSVIQSNYESEEDEQKIMEIHFDGQEYEVNEQNITLIKTSIETETNYKVEFEKDEDTGIIYRVVINKK